MSADGAALDTALPARGPGVAASSGASSGAPAGAPDAASGATAGPAGAAVIAPLAAAGLAAIACWLMLGDLGIAMRERVALPAGLELLRRNAASDTTTSLLLATVPALLSVLLVPFIGYHSDRYRSAWGRRRPFLLVIAPIGCLAMLGLALSPLLGGWTDAALGARTPGARICNLAWFCVFWTVFECAAISAASLFTGLVNDVVPQGLLGRFFAGFRIVGLGLGIGFNTWVFALTDHYLAEILAAIGAVFALSILLMCAAVRESCPPAASAMGAGPGRRALWVPRAHILECFRHRPFLWIAASFMLACATFGPFNTFCQYYAQGAGISKTALGGMTASGYMVSIASAFGIGWLADRYGAVRVSAICMGMYCAAAALGYMLIAGEASFRVFYIAHVVISGAYFTAAASMPMALFPRAQFVQYNSTKDLMVVFGNILVSGVQGPLLDSSGHDYRLTLLSGAVFSLLCVICMARVRRVAPP
ncbi:MFS transporter [Pseudoduganella sp. LjRoot289]|uniref:MFS transporter n=1 Tax=Pseudoduganella sp. LjRoot289 TaxID=3342314 RepID=UPI003ECDE20E